MDENKTIIDIKPFQSSKEEKPPVEVKQSFHSNPIMQKLWVINTKKTNKKFSLKDLFR